ncbi:hypothetical protein B0H13DRAFT_2010003 [Mycena leptocephala]|nr:hypothetical protein B0H13DRAFT_2010003 [Mycena leptocephala]
MLSILSVELLQEIGSELAKKDQKSFRAVSKDIGLSINPLFFADFVLKTQRLHLEATVDILTAVASGETGWSQYAKSLIIIHGYTRQLLVRREKPPKTEEANLSDEAIQNLLAAALGTMKKVRIVVWSVCYGDPVWLHDIILEFLLTAPLLDDFELKAEDVGDLELPSLSSLRKVKITAPNWKEVPLIEKFPRLVQQSLGLTSLHLFGGDGIAWSGVWRMLRRTANHHLKDIRARYSPALFEYIASYSGIEKLELKDPDLGDPNIFFHHLLPLHAASLEELSCSASYECRWSFSSDTVDALLKLHRLTHLTMSINRADIAVPVNAVEHLLRTAIALPALRSLTIRPANPERNLGAHCGNSTDHSRSVKQGIATGVRSLRCNCPSPVTVHVGYNSFELKPVDTSESGVEQDAVWGYHPIGPQLVYDW